VCVFFQWQKESDKPYKNGKIQKSPMRFGLMPNITKILKKYIQFTPYAQMTIDTIQQILQITKVTGCDWYMIKVVVLKLMLHHSHFLTLANCEIYYFCNIIVL
jgi:hypothetical protein